MISSYFEDQEKETFNRGPKKGIHFIPFGKRYFGQMYY